MRKLEGSAMSVALLNQLRKDQRKNTAYHKPTTITTTTSAATCVCMRKREDK